MRRLLLCLLALGETAAFAAGPNVCVRNYLGGGPQIDVCQAVGGRYVYVTAKDDPATRLCVITYDHGTCKANPKEYRFVVDTEDKWVCTVDYNQPPVVNYCQIYPELYAYANPANF